MCHTSQNSTLDLVEGGHDGSAKLNGSLSEIFFHNISIYLQWMHGMKCLNLKAVKVQPTHCAKLYMCELSLIASQI